MKNVETGIVHCGFCRMRMLTFPKASGQDEKQSYACLAVRAFNLCAMAGKIVGLSNMLITQVRSEECSTYLKALAVWRRCPLPPTPPIPAMNFDSERKLPVSQEARQEERA